VEVSPVNAGEAVRLFAGYWTSATLILAVSGCASTPRQSAAQASLCFPSQCVLDVQNDNAAVIAVAYYDSTGVGDVLGSVGAQSVRRFPLSRRTSRTITIEVSQDRQVFRTHVHLSLPPLPNVIHFPADFEPADTKTGS
jgi:hypothetical protein